MLNIEGIETIDDPFYRYKRREFKLVSEKHRTRIDNITEISKDLDRENDLIIDYLKKYFGTSFVIRDGKLYTKKRVEKNELNEALKYFIEYFVKCPNCGNPETKLKYNKMFCKSCDYFGKINDDNIKNKTCLKILDNLKKQKRLNKKNKKI